VLIHPVLQARYSMFWQRLFAGFVVALCFCFGRVEAVGGRLQDLPPLVEQSLQSGWDRNGENRDLNLQLPEIRDESTAYQGLAWALNRIQQYKYDQALEAARRVTENDASQLDGWYMRAWLEMRADNIDAGLLALQSYRRQLDRASLEEAARRRHLLRMARLLAFADGPQNSKATPVTLDQTIDRLLDQLEPGDVDVFSQEYHRITDQPVCRHA